MFRRGSMVYPIHWLPAVAMRRAVRAEGGWSAQSAALAVLVAALLVISIGCHTMRFEVGDGPVGKVVHDRKAFFVAGLFPTRNVDVGEFCPAGAAAVMEETTFVDGLLGAVTLSIYTPRSSTYYCSVEGQ